MYAPPQFREERPQVLEAAIAAIGFAVLVIPADGALDAVHLPLLPVRSGDGLELHGHVARPNPIWRRAGNGAAALAAFQGPQAYVHPGWYPTKRATGRAVPTWNYVAVHAHGTVAAEQDPAWLRAHLDALTARHEAGRPEPWTPADAPADYLDALRRGIVGLRLRVTRLEGAWKLIQHHPEGNRLGAIAGLAASARAGDREVAALMHEREAPSADG